MPTTMYPVLTLCDSKFVITTGGNRIQIYNTSRNRNEASKNYLADVIRNQNVIYDIYSGVLRNPYAYIFYSILKDFHNKLEVIRGIPAFKADDGKYYADALSVAVVNILVKYNVYDRLYGREFFKDFYGEIIGSYAAGSNIQRLIDELNNPESEEDLREKISAEIITSVCRVPSIQNQPKKMEYEFSTSTSNMKSFTFSTSNSWNTTIDF